MAKSRDAGWNDGATLALWTIIVIISMTLVSDYGPISRSSPFGDTATEFGGFVVTVFAIGAALYARRGISGLGRIAFAVVQFAGAAFVLAVTAGAAFSANGVGPVVISVLVPAAACEVVLGVSVLRSSRTGSTRGR